jgi:hypothetical protein
MQEVLRLNKRYGQHDVLTEPYKHHFKFFRLLGYYTASGGLKPFRNYPSVPFLLGQLTRSKGYVDITKFPNLRAQFLFSSTRFGLTRGHLQEMFSVAFHLVATFTIALSVTSPQVSQN